MATGLDSLAVSANDTYRRQARRARARWAGDPARMHLVLGELARQQNAESSTTQAGRATTFAPATTTRARPISFAQSTGTARPVVSHGAAQRFAAMVEACLEGQVLRYTRRQALIRAAARLGINRFDASLMIAAIQHRAPRMVVCRTIQPRQRGFWTALSAVAFVESLVGWGAWWMVHAS